ncbi:hypothetical protein [Actinophytocola sp.]|uniref:hypothetical protein n=1 Tax=Actinophytocola sp. TaxID=1872138 RepID=UPI00389A5872
MSGVRYERCTEDPAHWFVSMPGLPVAADGASFDEAIDEMIDALREYAEDWQERLLDAPNHRDNWGLVQLISISDDEQLRDWLLGAEPGRGDREVATVLDRGQLRIHPIG